MGTYYDKKRPRYRSGSGRRVRRMRRRGRPISGRRGGPLLIVFLVLLFVAALAAAVVFLIVPMFQGTYDGTAPEVVAAEPLPTEAPHTVQVVELGALQKEVALSDRYVNSPWVADGAMVLVGGTDDYGNPAMRSMYLLDLGGEESEPTRLSLSPENDEFFHVRMNERWIVYCDGNSDEGGTVMAYERATGETLRVKDYYAGAPELAPDGDTLCFMERTGTYMDKLYVCDLNTLECVAVATFEESVYGQSEPSAANGQLIWADGGTDGGSVICSLDLETGELGSFDAGTYVHDPVTNGTDWAWIDSNHEAGAKLYLSVAGSEPQVLAENVLNYGISEEFVAYDKDGAIYVYFIEDGYEQIITPAAERGWLACVANGTVLWYETGVSSSRDLLKYAVID